MPRVDGAVDDVLHADTRVLVLVCLGLLALVAETLVVGNETNQLLHLVADCAQ